MREKHVHARVCLVYNGPTYLLVDPSGDPSCQPIRAQLLPGLTNQSAGLMSHNWWLFIDPNSAFKAHWEGDKVAQDGDKVSFGMQLFHVLVAMYILASFNGYYFTWTQACQLSSSNDLHKPSKLRPVFSVSWYSFMQECATVCCVHILDHLNNY